MDDRPLDRPGPPARPPRPTAERRGLLTPAEFDQQKAKVLDAASSLARPARTG
jgi:hypothetical protein